MNILDSSLASVLVVCFISEVIRTGPDRWVDEEIDDIRRFLINFELDSLRDFPFDRISSVTMMRSS